MGKKKALRMRGAFFHDEMDLIIAANHFYRAQRP